MGGLSIGMGGYKVYGIYITVEVGPRRFPAERALGQTEKRRSEQEICLVSSVEPLPQVGSKPPPRSTVDDANTDTDALRNRGTRTPCTVVADALRRGGKTAADRTRSDYQVTETNSSIRVLTSEGETIPPALDTEAVQFSF